MSHCFGVICPEHGTVIEPDTCPERGCPGQHGYVYADRCGPRCPHAQPPSPASPRKEPAA